MGVFGLEDFERLANTNAWVVLAIMSRLIKTDAGAVRGYSPLSFSVLTAATILLSNFLAAGWMSGLSLGP